mgnify:FL=1
MTTKSRLLAVLLLGVCLSAGSSVGQELDLSLGTKEWPAIMNGVVFFNGEYIPPPYTVSRVESVIFINGRRIDSGMVWPPPKAAPPDPVPDADPVMPSTITERTTNFDSDYIKYVSDKRQYLFARFGQDKGIELMVGVFQEMPCILKAERDATSPVGIVLVWKSGKVSHVDLVPPSRKPDNMTKEQALEIMDRLCEIYVRGLEGNNYFMFGRMTRRGLPVAFKRTLIPLADAMHAAKDEADFLAIMKTNQPTGGMMEEYLKMFYQHKADLPKWEPHVRETVEKEMR